MIPTQEDNIDSLVLRGRSTCSGCGDEDCYCRASKLTSSSDPEQKIPCNPRAPYAFAHSAVGSASMDSYSEYYAPSIESSPSFSPDDSSTVVLERQNSSDLTGRNLHGAEENDTGSRCRVRFNAAQDIYMEIETPSPDEFLERWYQEPDYLGFADHIRRHTTMFRRSCQNSNRRSNPSSIRRRDSMHTLWRVGAQSTNAMSESALTSSPSETTEQLAAFYRELDLVGLEPWLREEETTTTNNNNNNTSFLMPPLRQIQQDIFFVQQKMADADPYSLSSFILSSSRRLSLSSRIFAHETAKALQRTVVLLQQQEEGMEGSVFQ